MNILFWVGSVAAIFTTAAFFPQVIKIYKTKHTKDLSLMMYLMFSLGLVLWTIYGLMLKEIPIIAANIVTLFCAIYILFLKVKHG